MKIGVIIAALAAVAVALYFVTRPKAVGASNTNLAGLTPARPTSTIRIVTPPPPGVQTPTALVTAQKPLGVNDPGFQGWGVATGPSGVDIPGFYVNGQYLS